jgi:hypothetical protein
MVREGITKMAELLNKHDHERSDARVGPLAKFLIVMTAGVLFSFAFSVVLFEFFDQRVESKGPTASPVQVRDELAPEPRLQVVPGLDLRRQKALEEQRLTTYGWVEEENRIVRIPVDKAIDVLVENGLPAREETEGGR